MTSKTEKKKKDTVDVIFVDDFIGVFVSEDEETTDYDLEISIAKVLEINHSNSKLKVWWMFGTSWGGVWYEWKFKKTKKPYVQWIDTSSVIVVNRKWLKLTLTKKSGHVPHSSKYCIDQKSIEDIILLLGG